MVTMAVGQLRFFANGDDHHSLGHSPRNWCVRNCVLANGHIQSFLFDDASLIMAVDQLRFFANGDDHHSLGHRPRNWCVRNCVLPNGHIQSFPFDDAWLIMAPGQLRFFANGDVHHSLGHRPRIIRFAQRGVRQSALFSPISRSADGGPQVPAG